MNHFGDPGYKYHATMSQLWGVTALRLAQADVLPIDFEYYGSTINQFLTELEKDKQYDSAKLNLSAAHKAAQELMAAAAQTASLLKPAVAAGKLSPAQLTSINALLMKGETNFILPGGIPGRPWFKHILYSARYTYAHLELPAITEAVESGNWLEAQKQTEVLVNALKAETALMKQLSASVRSN
jgi:N-acetylated-alpha-linked acidic dipeptidase